MTTAVDRICPLPTSFPIRTSSLTTTVMPTNDSMISDIVERSRRVDSLDHKAIDDFESYDEQYYEEYEDETQEMADDNGKELPAAEECQDGELTPVQPPEATSAPSSQDDAEPILATELKDDGVDDNPLELPTAELVAEGDGAAEKDDDGEEEAEVVEKEGEEEVLVGREAGFRTNSRPSSAVMQSSSDNSPSSTPTSSPSRISEVVGRRRRSLSRSLSSRLRRSSWMPSRSPSPKKRDTLDSSSGLPTLESSPTLPPSRPVKDDGPALKATKARRRQSSFSKHITHKLRRKTSKPQLIASPNDDSSSALNTNQTSSSLPDLRAADKSTSRQSIFAARLFPSSEKSSVPSSTETLNLSKTGKLPKNARKRDDLWSAFRTLDNDCAKFEARLPEQKGSFVRASLVKFLEQYKSHPSNHKLRPEDLDRRATILHKWWMSLIAFVGGRLYLTLSPKDRTSLLDCVIGLMERPEWRSHPSPFCPTPNKRNSYPPSQSTESTSLSSDSVDLVMESVQHNIRTMFVQALLAQMGVVIERMSMRNNPPSMVALSGKTCAYAFFFCPGLGNAMVKLWNPSLDLLRRVLAESSASPMVDLSATVERISPSFPSAVKDLHFSKLSDLSKHLHTPPQFPFGTEDFAWRGSWLEKWGGLESDLFYTFVREYHLLLFDYLPRVTDAELLAAPGFLFVQSQILRNMDDSINRNSSKSLDLQQLFTRDGLSRLPEERRGPSNITFDDMLNDPDSTASPIPLGPAMNQMNADRQMAENRLIMLLRETISPKNAVPKHNRETFASTFAKLLRATAKRVNQFDRAACDTLCSFLEEMVVILVRYEQENDVAEPFLDWPFWIQVWRKMLDSHNYYTDLRVCCLIYSLWPAIAMNPQRKAEFCYEFLLEPSFFQSKFNHWSPMVRAYYMRLMCWRVARCNEDVGEADLKILDCLRIRLRETYSYYLFLSEEARKKDELLPSTAPSNAAPGRRITVVRSEPNQAANSYLPYDGAALSHAAYKRSLILDKACSVEARPLTAQSCGSSTTSDSDKDTDDKQMTGINRRWTGGLLRTIMSSSKQNMSRSKSPGGPLSRKTPTSAPQHQSKGKDVDATEQSASEFLANSQLSHRTYCFRFTMEMIDRRMQSQLSMILQTPKLPQPAQTLLTKYRSSTLLSESTADDNSKSSTPQQEDNSTEPKEPVGLPEQESIASAASNQADQNSDSSNIIPLARNPGLIIQPVKPPATLRKNCVYAGRALAEWTLVVNDCQAFFDRRKAEGVPGNRYVETPLLSTDAFRPR